MLDTGIWYISDFYPILIYITETWYICVQRTTPYIYYKGSPVRYVVIWSDMIWYADLHKITDMARYNWYSSLWLDMTRLDPIRLIWPDMTRYHRSDPIGSKWCDMTWYAQNDLIWSKWSDINRYDPIRSKCLIRPDMTWYDPIWLIRPNMTWYDPTWLDTAKIWVSYGWCKSNTVSYISTL